jgi:photoactive yellow protein
MPEARFQSDALHDVLDAADAQALDALDFGLIGIDAQGLVQRYNALESKLSGLAASRVLGRSLFETVAPCMNNAMVAGRLAAAAQQGSALDCTLDYMLALRMRPVKVRLRLLARGHSQNQERLRYVLIDRRS